MFKMHFPYIFIPKNRQLKINHRRGEKESEIGSRIISQCPEGCRLHTFRDFSVPLWSAIYDN